MTSTRPVPPALRTLTQTGGNVLGRLFGLRPATSGYTVNRVEVPMRDGVALVADHYAPTTSSPVGTVLVRGPYGRGYPFSLVFAWPFATRGYHVVLQSVRGTFGSGGVFEPMANEITDSADTAAWLVEQPWFTGRFATIGTSYQGFTQWALLQDPPPELAAAVIAAGPHDFHAALWDTGSFTIDFLLWSDMVAHQEDPSRVQAGIRQLLALRRVARAAAGVPFGESARALLGTGAPWFESWVERPDPDDAFCNQLRCSTALDRVQVPVLLMSGWQDVFLRQTLQQYAHLRRRGADVALTVGPWTHTQMLGKGLPTNARETLDWLDTHLAGTTELSRPSRVRVGVTGQGWRDLPDWPPVTSQRALYLRPGRYLDEASPKDLKGLPPATFHYDPADPTPTVGGPSLSTRGGYRDDSRLALRDDVLTFNSATLLHDLCVYGNPIVELAHSSNNPHVDLFVRVSELDAKGHSRNVSDGYRRLAAPAKTVSIELDAIAHRFRAGSRIRLFVTGSWFPRYARNLGTGEPMLTARQSKPATHAIAYGSSRLLLPVGPLDLSAHGVADAGGNPG
ncbi:hydrolase [Mycobacterium montefiorense]|uniref:Hydrolase n=2 Tax=Mycobacterium montefiorense TaxID=154654 RepID=A0AA37PRT3_9MYCO|nr:hydrolase [Mycobacterium montefiorense]GKU35863.1 hydrolase [Mycobacterium montefiorense]GKU40765.1 hydrolase [Mycobacterium montefiorense]GKU44304.1 hydrolase [Mycobacterium montefiorense]GKU51808.1 hydrolase [Mycobacterium montefiorense]